MKVIKLKNSVALRQILISIGLIGLGFYLHSLLTPDFSAMMKPHEDPFVSVKGLQKEDISVKKKFIAEVEAINTVDIVPQIAGYLQEVRFQEGALVQAGDILFVIEQEKFKANVQVAEANLEKAKSDMATIQADYQRQEKLYKDKFISKSGLDNWKNKLTQAEANIKQAEASLKLAQIDLGYTEIKAPITGYIGKVLVSKGNYVSPAVPALARVVQTDPIRIGFSVSDKERLAFLEHIKENKDDIHFEIAFPTGKTEEVSVENIFANNEINPETATLPVYIDYQNPDKKLIPGNYVDILVSVGSLEKSLVVPVVALAQDINGTYVMVVNSDNVVEQKYVELGKVSGSYQEVKSGLNDTDNVIVQGLQKVQSGSKVKPIIVKE